MFDYIGVTLRAAGCTNSCRHCSIGASPPFGELISLADAEWVVAQIRPHAKTFFLYATHEVTAHPDYVALWQLCGDATNDLEGDMRVISTNGWGIARSDTWEKDIDGLKEAGTRSVDLSFHGIGETHDWLVRRPGAYEDLLVTMRRMASRGIRILTQYFLDRRNMTDLPRMLKQVAQWSEDIGQELRLNIELPGYTVTDRLREFEAKLRPVPEDFEPVVSILEERKLYQPLTQHTEAAWIDRKSVV